MQLTFLNILKNGQAHGWINAHTHRHTRTHTYAQDGETLPCIIIDNLRTDEDSVYDTKS